MGDLYRGYRVEYWPPPIPVRDHDWSFWHLDYDGADDAHDSRYGWAASEEEAHRAIDEQLEELADA